MRLPLFFSLFFLFLTACTSPADFSTPQPVHLLSYLTSTPLPSHRTPPSLVPPQTPLPTPTPFPYTVQQGDTISGIALKFGLSIDAILAANPDINPNLLPVGTVLHIPSQPQGLADEATPTPASFTVEQVECYPTANRGMWCFVLARNDSPDLMENLSAQVTLVNSHGEMLASQPAFLPLNILPANTSLPLAVYFPPDVPPQAEPRVQVLAAIRLLPGDARYLPVTLHDTLVEVGAGGHFARLTGEVRLPPDSPPASQVWVAAVAYDEQDRVAGVRRWQGGGIPPGGSLRFEMTLASLGGVVKRVEFAAEARP